MELISQRLTKEVKWVDVSLHAEFMGTKHYGHIHKYGPPTFGNINGFITKQIYYGNQLFWSL